MINGLALGRLRLACKPVPTDVIRITKVSRAEVLTQSLSQLVPGARSLREHLKPTTRYLRQTPLPTGLDTFLQRSIRRQHLYSPFQPTPCLTQWHPRPVPSVFLIQNLRTGGSASASSDVAHRRLFVDRDRCVYPWCRCLATHRTQAGRFRPGKTFLGFCTSWLSREIVMFGVYASACLVWNVWFLRSCPLGRFTAVDHAGDGYDVGRSRCGRGCIAGSWCMSIPAALFGAGR